jgi:hypothetical protein
MCSLLEFDMVAVSVELYLREAAKVLKAGRGLVESNHLVPLPP